MTPHTPLWSPLDITSQSVFLNFSLWCFLFSLIGRSHVTGFNTLLWLVSLVEKISVYYSKPLLSFNTFNILWRHRPLSSPPLNCLPEMFLFLGEGRAGEMTETTQPGLDIKTNTPSWHGDMVRRNNVTRDVHSTWHVSRYLVFNITNTTQLGLSLSLRSSGGFLLSFTFKVIF